MKFESRNAPHIHHQESTRVLMIDMMLALLVVYGMAFYYYGIRVAVLCLVSVATTVISDIVCRLISRRTINIRDWSSVVSGMLIPLLLPASIPIHIVVVAGVFGIVVAKHPFGGTGHNVFNPAAAGLAFVTICFTSQIFSYPTPLQPLPVFPTEEIALVNSPAFSLSLNGAPNLDLTEMLLGNFPGPMGATNILVVLACLLFLILRGTVRWELPVFYILTSAFISFCFPRIQVANAYALAYEMMSGSLLFGGVFLLPDPVTSPKRDWARIVYAAVASVVVMLFRRLGNLEEGFVFAVLLMNATVWSFDIIGERLARLYRRSRIAVINRKEVQKKV